MKGMLLTKNSQDNLISWKQMLAEQASKKCVQCNKERKKIMSASSIHKTIRNCDLMLHVN